MASSQVAPPVFKGALATVSASNPRGTVVVFQYNPASLSRMLKMRTSGGEGGSGAPRFAGPPEQTVKLSVEIDATDQLEAGDAVTNALGILPALAALEVLLHPSSAVVVANEALTRAGVVELLPAQAPLTLLVWGARRILPVSITEFSVTEEAFDLALHPTMAKVDLGLEVLTYQELGMLSTGGALSLANHIATEALAAIGASGTLSGLVGNAVGIGGQS
jgi:hypothetical protein